MTCNVYIDQDTGDDLNAGTSQTLQWSGTLSKIEGENVPWVKGVNDPPLPLDCAGKYVRITGDVNDLIQVGQRLSDSEFLPFGEQTTWHPDPYDNLIARMGGAKATLRDDHWFFPAQISGVFPEEDINIWVKKSVAPYDMSAAL